MKRHHRASIVAMSAITLTAASWPFGSEEAAARPAARVSPPRSSGGADHHFVVVKHTLTLEGARRVLEAATAKARERNAGAAIAVVDDGGNLVAFQRLEGTFPAGANVAIGKARTAALFRKPTRAFEEAITGGRTALAAVQEMTPLQGGVPIIHDGHIIGAIGVSGAHSQVEDEEVAIAGAAAVESRGSGH